NGARNFFASRHQRALVLHWFAALYWKLPVMPEFVECVIDGLGFDCADAAATHGVIEHAVTIPRWPVVFFVRDVVQHGSVPIFSFERSAHDRPEISRDGCAIGN